MKHSAEWFLIEEINKAHIFLLAGWGRNSSRDFEKEFNGNIEVGLLHRDGTLELYFKDKEWERAEKSVFTKSLEDYRFLEFIKNKNQGIQKQQFRLCKTIQKKDLTLLSDQKLIELYYNFSERFAESVCIGWIDMAMEFRNGTFSSYLTNYLNNRVKEKSSTTSGAEAFSLFSTPSRVTIGKKEENDLLKIIEKILEDKKTYSFFQNRSIQVIDKGLDGINKKINQLLDNHVKQYNWIFFMYTGPEWTRTDFIKRIKEDLGKDDISVVIKNSKFEQDEINNRRKYLSKELAIDTKHLKLLELSSEMVFNKDLRKHSIFFSCFVVRSIFQELGKRIGIRYEDLRRVLPWELYELFQKGEIDKIKQEIKKNKEVLMLFKNGKCTKLFGSAITRFLKNNVIKEKVGLMTELKGSCAFPGSLQGVVKIINGVEDIPKIKSGEILVAHQTNPDVVMAMKKASGFITDLGGITCHAAIVAREMKKPCIVGTKVATRVLKDGDIVEVDAEKGVVKILK
ncbi:MAG: PEP-utilizing enzyme [Patescibacteria group bacterium]|nr:PEP-utilizing enzyme [Patescibacteria group bacterium]